MKPSLLLLCAFGLLHAAAPLYAQTRPVRNQGTQQRQSLEVNALLINISAEVLDNNAVVWNQNDSKITIPGRPVRLNLVGSNLVVIVQFTPFIRMEGIVLVAHAQIWIRDDEAGAAGYYTSIQTIPIEFDEPVHFFPLGTSEQSNPTIEINITVNPTDATESPEQ